MVWIGEWEGEGGQRYEMKNIEAQDLHNDGKGDDSNDVYKLKDVSKEAEEKGVKKEEVKRVKKER